MNKKCPNCHLINFPDAANCKRCECDLQKNVVVSTAADAAAPPTFATRIVRRALICAVVCVFVLLAFYLSLIISAKRLDYDQTAQIDRGIKILEEKGFARETFLLRYLTAYRAEDNWLNASTQKETAYAATNFPFEIMTVYPDFFTYALDDTDAAAILLHEAQHLQGKDEKEAYEFVWKNRHKLGWTEATHGGSKVWENTRRQTTEICPELFQCDWQPRNDCTERQGVTN